MNKQVREKARGGVRPKSRGEGSKINLRKRGSSALRFGISTMGKDGCGY